MKNLIIALLCFLPLAHSQAQNLTGIDESGNLTQIDGQGNNTFNPNRKDTTQKSKVVPKGIYVWAVDKKLGDIIKAEVDTIPHLYPSSTLAKGTYGTYNTVGSNYSARLSRIFIDRPNDNSDQFFFTQTYSQFLRSPEQFHFTNTLSPITNLSYDNCGDKNDGEDHIEAKFAVNADKRTGFGFDIDYCYARGYFQNQSNAHFNASLYGSYLGDKYQLHAIYTQRHLKSTENGGITNDDYITHPDLFSESFSDNEIPVVLSSNWNRNHSHNLFLTHRYNLGFYKKVKMTDEEIKARQFAEQSKKNRENTDNKKTNDTPKGRPDKSMPVPAGRPDNAPVVGKEPVAPTTGSTTLTDSLTADTIDADTTRIKVTSKAMADSLLAASAREDSLAATMKKEFVPVTSFIHTLEFNTHEHIYQAYNTPDNYFANTYFNLDPDNGYPGDSIYDQTKQLTIKNTLGLALLEGFNKWAKAGVKVFATHELRRFNMAQLDDAGHTFMGRWTEHNISLGGRISKTQGQTFHYLLSAETWLIGQDFGQLKADFSTDLNFQLWGDTVRLAAKGAVYRMSPTFYERRYHSKHFWWDHSLGMTTRTRAEGLFSYDKTKTKVRVAIDEIQNYTYIGMSYNATTSGRTALTANIYQNSDIINLLTLQFDQKIDLGPLHWDNIITYQSTSHPSIIPLPTLNIFSNLYLKFVYAKVLTVELGGAATYFTSYEAPDYLPQLNQFAIQENDASRVTIGNIPIIDVYANLHLKHARFFVMMNNLAATSFNRKAFLTPHYPLNRSVLHIGVSWNFFN